MIIRKISEYLIDWDLIENKNFINQVLPSLELRSHVLDAGAGDLRYKKYFRDFEYTSVDFCKLDKPYGEIDIVCDLAHVPLEDETFDIILCLQVLEHVPDPLSIVKELYRLLKKGGLLLITVPQCWGEHEEPYDFYRFTRYSLSDIFETAGFKKVSIETKGGYFLFLGQTIILAAPTLVTKNTSFSRILRVLILIIGLLIAWPLRMFDFLDKEKRITLGYKCICIKAGEQTGDRWG
jgi:SAM-dependent methyltransferase